MSICSVELASECHQRAFLPARLFGIFEMPGIIWEDWVNNSKGTSTYHQRLSAILVAGQFLAGNVRLVLGLSELLLAFQLLYQAPQSRHQPKTLHSVSARWATTRDLYN